MTEAVETSTFMEGSASRRSVPVQRSWKPQERAASPRALRTPPKVQVALKQPEVRPPAQGRRELVLGGQEQSQVQSPVREDEARRRMALFQAQRLLLAARPFDSIEYFYVHQELKYYLRLDEQDQDQVGGGGWWRWITTLLCGGDAARGGTTILV